MGAVIHKGVPDAWQGYEIFRKYKFEHIKLGVGATCQVHDAVQIGSDTHYAVKIIVKEEAEALGKGAEDLRTEAAIMAKLKHPNICSFFELFEDSELMFFVLELCDGGTLFEKLEYEILFEEGQAKKLGKMMFKALQYLNDKGFAHRDLRPESWMLADLSEDADLKLSNFRMAVECDKNGELVQPCGTLHYVAPEVLRGRYGRQADTWTLGVLLFLIVYGSYPFDGDSADLVMKSILSSEPDWSNSCYAVSFELRELLKRLLTKEPEHRMTVDQALKHVWFPKQTFSRPSSRQGSRAGSRRGSLLDQIFTRKSARNSQQGNISNRSSLTQVHAINNSNSFRGSLRKININEVDSSTAQENSTGHSATPHLRSHGGSRRCSAMVNQDLIKFLERKLEEEKEKQHEGVQSDILERFSVSSSKGSNKGSENDSQSRKHSDSPTGSYTYGFSDPQGLPSGQPSSRAPSKEKLSKDQAMACFASFSQQRAGTNSTNSRLLS